MNPPPPPTHPPPASSSTLYFAYGSNLSRTQMAQRCPSSRYLGVALLRDWRWIINSRGYANVVPAPGDVVYGLAYGLRGADEARLDGYEGVPDAYGKEVMEVEVWAEGGRAPGSGEEGVVRSGLVYVDGERVGEGRAREEYVRRMNRGIEDAVGRGVPVGYVRRVLRRFVPEEGGGWEGGVRVVDGLS